MVVELVSADLIPGPSATHLLESASNCKERTHVEMQWHNNYKAKGPLMLDWG